MKKKKMFRIWAIAAMSATLALTGCAKGPDLSPETNFVYEKQTDGEKQTVMETVKGMTEAETLPQEERLIVLRSSLYPMEEGAANKGLKVTIQGAYAYDQVADVENFFSDQDFIAYCQRRGIMDADGKAVGEGCFLVLDVLLRNQNSQETEFNLHELQVVNLDMSGDWLYLGSGSEPEGLDPYQNDKMSKDAHKYTLAEKEETAVQIAYFMDDQSMVGVRDGSHQLAVSICNDNIRITSENAGEYTGDGIVYLLIDWEKVKEDTKTGEMA